MPSWPIWSLRTADHPPPDALSARHPQFVVLALLYIGVTQRTQAQPT
jgi:hypothetical protein